MKPIFLSIEGINSFTDRQTIDFRFSGLFCISGDTGSGKSTILDSIIIALYGSGKRSPISDYINLKRDRAEIRLQFETEANGKRRSLEVTRILLRNAPSKAKLVDLHTGETVAEQTEKVNEALREMIGLCREDFTQVVILEQGRFAKFLTAGKKERNETVGSLFKLSKYKDLGHKFAEKKNAVKSELDIIAKRLTELKDVTASAASALEKDIRSGNKQREVIEETIKRLTLECDFLQECKRRYDKYIEQKNKLDELCRNEKIFSAKLIEDTLKLEEVGEQLKKATENKQKFEVKAASAAALKGLIDEESKLSAEVDKLRSEWKSADDDRKKAEERYQKAATMLNSTKSEFQSAIGEILSVADLGEIGEYFDISDIKSAAIKLDYDHKQFKYDYEENDKKLNEQKEKIKNEKDMASAVMAALAVATNRRDKIKAELKHLIDKKEEFHRSEAAHYLRAGLKEGDVCPVCGGKIVALPKEKELEDADTASVEKELAAAESEVVKLGNNQHSYAMLISDSEELYKKYSEAYIAAKKKYDEICGKIRVPEKFARIVEMCNNAEKLGKLVVSTQHDEALLLQKKDNAIEKTAEIQRRGEAERERLDRLRASIGDNRLTAEELDSEQKLKELVREVERLSAIKQDLEAACSDHKAKLSAARASIGLISGEVVEPTFDAEALTEKLTEKQDAEKSRDELIAKIAASEQKLKAVYDSLKIKRELESERDERKKKFDLYSDIYKLVSGDKFIEYVAEEYILQFTQAASEVLGTVTGGKYTLSYSGGEFYVKDFLSDGMERKATTLSGGETFLASLSLAIAISSEISKFKTYEFFFLDEGFGTLDAASLDTVMNALELLSSDTLVGVVTHRSEITDRIFDKITVLAANGDNGSVVLRCD